MELTSKGELPEGILVAGNRSASLQGVRPLREGLPEQVDLVPEQPCAFLKLQKWAARVLDRVPWGSNRVNRLPRPCTAVVCGAVKSQVWAAGVPWNRAFYKGMNLRSSLPLGLAQQQSAKSRLNATAL